MSRKHLRADPIPIRPVSMTQQTCMSVAGVTPRQFCETLTAHPELPRAKVGRLRLVRLDDWEKWIGRLSESGQDDPIEEEVDDFPRTVAEGLKELGYDHVPANVGARRRA